jgi:membrane protein required for beta-lactamase induction
MKLLALLILMALRRVEFRHDPAQWRATFDRALLSPLSLLAMVTRTSAMRLVLLVVLWAAVGFLLRFGLEGVLLSWPLLLIYLGTLWILVGRDRLGPDLNEYLRLWYLKDEQALRDHAQTRFGVAEAALPALHAGVLRALFVRAYGETFAWIVVFAVTGLPGLLALAALDATVRDSGIDGQRDTLLVREAREMRARLDWLAVRLLGMTLLLTGNSGRVWPILDSRLLDDEDPAEELTADLCVAASGIAPGDAGDVGLDITDARGLLLRTQVIWAMLMAVSVIVGF